jgi:hypothetical protein
MLVWRRRGRTRRRPQGRASGAETSGTWCLPGTAADAVVTDLAATLTKNGWTDVRTRGDAVKAGVSADRNTYRLSYVVSASSAANCRAPGHYLASATMFQLSLTP